MSLFESRQYGINCIKLLLSSDFLIACLEIMRYVLINCTDQGIFFFCNVPNYFSLGKIK